MNDSIVQPFEDIVPSTGTVVVPNGNIVGLPGTVVVLDGMPHGAVAFERKYDWKTERNHDF